MILFALGFVAGVVAVVGGFALKMYKDMPR